MRLTQPRSNFSISGGEPPPPEIECDALAFDARANLAIDEYLERWTRNGGIVACSASLVEAGLVMVACDRHDDLAVAVGLLRVSTPWTDAAIALAERRYADAASTLEAIPRVPLRNAALRLAKGN